MTARVLVVGGSPERVAAAALRDAAAACDAVVAVDRGLDALLQAELGCDVFCGDLDSVSDTGARLVRAAEARLGTDAPSGCDRSPISTVHSAATLELRIGAVERYNPAKDFTDLALALRAVEARWRGASLVATCLTGGRPDHALAALGRLATWPGAVTLIEDGFTARILHANARWAYIAPTGTTLSFIPLTPQAIVSETGMRWELDRARVPLLSDLGVSNIITAADAAISCHEGTIAAWAFSSEAPSV